MDEKLTKLNAIIEKKKAIKNEYTSKMEALIHQQDEYKMEIDSLTNKIAEAEKEKSNIQPELDVYASEVAELEAALADILAVTAVPVVEEKPIATITF